MKGYKRMYCKCGYCPYISRHYRTVAMHIEYKHDAAPPIVIERFYKQVPEEVNA